jgi:hypothetical protein
MASSGASRVRAGPIPELAFTVEDAAGLEYAAVPTVRFRLAIGVPSGAEIRSLLLDVQVQIAARRRSYDDLAQERLSDLFGTPERWGETLRTLPWLRTTVVVPAFTASTTVDVDLPLTYDLEVSASRYLQALDDGAVPLELLFGGTIFYATPEGRLQTALIPWTHEVEHPLPVRVWRETMDRHFPNSAWLRLDRDTYDRLLRYRSRAALPSWERAIDSLLQGEDA